MKRRPFLKCVFALVGFGALPMTPTLEVVVCPSIVGNKIINSTSFGIYARANEARVIDCYCCPGLTTGANDGTSMWDAWQSFSDIDLSRTHSD